LYIYTGWVKISDEISRKLSISERNIPYKSCRILNSLFTDLVNLTLSGITKIRPKSHWFFFNGTFYFWFQNLINGIKSFSKHYNKVIFYKVFFTRLGGYNTAHISIMQYRYNLDLTFATPPKVRLTRSVNRSFKTLQLLQEIFLSEMLSFRVIILIQDFLLTLYSNMYNNECSS